ncbi:hypothetical protein BU14_2071s0002, partial [Porphyra umbilicalis]
ATAGRAALARRAPEGAPGGARRGGRVAGPPWICQRANGGGAAVAHCRRRSPPCGARTARAACGRAPRTRTDAAAAARRPLPPPRRASARRRAIDGAARLPSLGRRDRRGAPCAVRSPGPRRGGRQAGGGQTPPPPRPWAADAGGAPGRRAHRRRRAGVAAAGGGGGRRRARACARRRAPPRRRRGGGGRFGGRRRSGAGGGRGAPRKRKTPWPTRARRPAWQRPPRAPRNVRAARRGGRHAGPADRGRLCRGARHVGGGAPTPAVEAIRVGCGRPPRCRPGAARPPSPRTVVGRGHPPASAADRRGRERADLWVGVRPSAWGGHRDAALQRGRPPPQSGATPAVR